MTMTMISPAFVDGGTIPPKYARDGENLMPPLRWTGAPERTRSFALMVDDADAPSGTFHHCAVYNIPPDWTGLRESLDTGPERAIRFGRNDFGGEAYDGPQPPPGHGVHHYHFHLAALDVDKLDLPAHSDARSIWRAARPHMLEEAELVGTFER